MTPTIYRTFYVATDWGAAVPTSAVNVAFCSSGSADVRASVRGYGGKALVYTLAASVNSDFATSGITYAQCSTNNWLAKDNNSALIKLNGLNEYLCDIRSQAFMTAWINGALSYASAWDGIEVDNALTSWKYGIGSGGVIPANIPTWISDSSQYTPILGEFIRQINVAFTNAGQVVYLNCSPIQDPSGAYRPTVETHSEGAMDENFLRAGTNPIPPDSGSNYSYNWRASFNAIKEAGNLGVDALTKWAGGTTAENAFAVATYALAAVPGKAAFSQQTSYSTQGVANPFSGISALGEPLSDATVAGSGLWSRQFANGILNVNPTAATAGGVPTMSSTLVMGAPSPPAGDPTALATLRDTLDSKTAVYNAAVNTYHSAYRVMKSTAQVLLDYSGTDQLVAMRDSYAANKASTDSAAAARNAANIDVKAARQALINWTP